MWIWRAIYFFPIHLRSRMWLLALMAQIVAATAMISTLFIGERVRAAFENSVAEFIAADVRVEHSDLDLPKLRQLANQARLSFAHTHSLSTSVLSADDELYLTRIKAVDESYPLRGRLWLERDSLYSPDSPPAKGMVWADRHFAKVGMDLGEELRVGDVWLKISAFIEREPDQDLLGPGSAPRLMLNHADLARTGLETSSSRSRVRALFAGERPELEKFIADLELPEGATITWAREGRRDVNQILRYFSLFINLAGFVAILFASIILYLALQLLMSEERRLQSLLFDWGYNAIQRNLWFWLRILGILIVANGFAVVLALLVQNFVVESYLVGIFPEIPSLKRDDAWYPTLASLAVLPIAALSVVAVVWRPRQEKVKQSSYMLVLSWLALSILLAVYYFDSLDNLYLFAGLFLAVLIGAICYWLMTLLLFRRSLSSGVYFSLLRNGLATRPRLNLLYVGALGLVMMIVSTVYLLRVGSVWSIEENLGPDTPNHFLVSVQPDDKIPLRRELTEALALERPPQFLPIIRARVSAVNDEPVNLDGVGGGARNTLLREWSLSFIDHTHNTIVAGEWFGRTTGDGEGSPTDEWSISTEVVGYLDVGIGDQLSFNVSGDRVYSAPVGSIRKVNWGTAKPNFFVLASPGMLQKAPKTYLTALRIPPRQEEAFAAILKNYPGVTDLDLTVIIEHFQEFLEIFVELISLILLYTLVLALIVVYCILQFGMETTRRETALLNTFGVSKKILSRVRLSRNLLLAIPAVAPATLLAILISNDFYQRVLQTTVPNHLILGLATIFFAGLLSITALSWLMEKFLIGEAFHDLRFTSDYHS